MSGYLFASKTIGSELYLRFLPVMITRLLLSLKKANTLHEHGWSVGEPATHTNVRFSGRRSSAVTRDEMRLDTFASTQEGTSGQA